MCEQLCNFQNCAVCKKVEEREVFKNILKNRVPDIVICDNVSYLITKEDGNTIEIPNFEYVKKGKVSYYIQDVYTGSYIKLTNQNFKVICKANNKECTLTPYVETYSSKQESS